jgi:hypothetical protein
MRRLARLRGGWRKGEERKGKGSTLGDKRIWMERQVGERRGRLWWDVESD